MASTQYNGQYVTMYSGVPFSPDYAHTLYGGINDKATWLDACTHTKYDNLMHIKLDTTSGYGTIRLEVPDNVATSYNYCLVNSKNDPYFCFILGCRYINDGKTSGSSVYEFDIQKDVMMSCFNDKDDLIQCAIERHHSSTDGHFNNPWVPEPFAFTAYNQDFNQLPFETADCHVVIQYYIANPNNDDAPGLISDAGRTISRIPCGTLFAYARLGDDVGIHNFICNDAQMGGCVTAVYTAPKCLFKNTPPMGGMYLNDSDLEKDVKTAVVEPYDSVPSTVENNKCLYYPYNFYRVYNDAGETMDLKYELWGTTAGAQGGSALMLGIEGVAVAPVEVCIRPLNYIHANSQREIDFFGVHFDAPGTHKLRLNGYPMGSWINDVYASAVGRGEVYNFDKAHESVQGFFKEQKRMAERVFLTGGGASALKGTLGGSESALATSMIEGGLNAMTAAANLSYAPDTLSGSGGSGGSDYAGLHKYFYGSHMALNEDDFKRLDSMFTRYGYAQGGLVAKPDPEARSVFTYIKTAGDPFVSSGDNKANATEASRINTIFRNGITFWKTSARLDQIGKYSNINNGTDSMPQPQGMGN